MPKQAIRAVAPLVLALCVVATAANGQTPGQSPPIPTVSDIALYAGPDRLEKLAAGAKKEGELAI